MNISFEPVLYIIIFIAVLAIVEGVYLTVFGKSISLNSRVNRRLELLEKGAKREETLEQLRKELSLHLSSQGIPLYSILAKKAQIAAIAFTPRQLVLIMLFVSIFAFVAMTVTTSATSSVRLVLALFCGVGGVYAWVNNKAKKRMALLDEQLPDAVELMVRSLRVGHPFSSAIQVVATEIPDPLGSEIGIIADEAAYGRDIGEALTELADRLDNQDMRFLAVAVIIQQTSGGNLAEILDGLAKVIRSRFKLFRRVRAITAEAKWSGMFLSGFPFLALIGINVAQPGYYDEVSQTPFFIPGCLIVAAFLFVNVIVMRMLVDIKV